MDSKNLYSKDRILSFLRTKLDAGGSAAILDNSLSGQQIAILLAELEIFQLELEMQNDELTASHQLLEVERTKFAGFFNMAPVGYFVLDHLGFVEEGNQTGANLLKISVQDILSKRFQSFVKAEMWEHFYAFLLHMQTIHGKQTCEIILISHDQTELYTRMEGIAIRHAYTNQLQYYITITDISESRAAQQKLIDTKRRLEMTLKASGTGTWTVDLLNNRMFLDDFSLDLLEIRPWEFEGTIASFVGLVFDEDQQLMRQTIFNAFNNHQELDFEFRILTKNNNLKTISIKGQLAENKEGIRCFAGVLMDITDRKRLLSETQQLQRAQQKLVMSATFKAQEKERNRISHALHDSVCQILYGIRLHLQNVQYKQSSDQQFSQINHLLDQAIAETRELSYELTPSVLRDFGFVEGIKEMVQRLVTPQFRIKTNIQTKANRLHSEVQLYLFRMIQELLNNCIKHAEASEVVLSVRIVADHVHLSVTDNGKGFSTEVEQALTLGSGMRSIKNRIFLLNGSMKIETSKTGTLIDIKFKSKSEL